MKKKKCQCGSVKYHIFWKNATKFIKNIWKWKYQNIPKWESQNGGCQNHRAGMMGQNHPKIDRFSIWWCHRKMIPKSSQNFWPCPKLIQKWEPKWSQNDTIISSQIWYQNHPKYDTKIIPQEFAYGGKIIPTMIPVLGHLGGCRGCKSKHHSFFLKWYQKAIKPRYTKTGLVLQNFLIGLSILKMIPKSSQKWYQKTFQIWNQIAISVKMIPNCICIY